MSAVLSTAPEDYLNPQYIVDFAASKMSVAGVKITRENYYDRDTIEFE